MRVSLLLPICAIAFAACDIVGADDPAPRATFEIDCMRLADSTVRFVNLSTHASAHRWLFGDGATSTDANPTHVYAEPGYYNVSLVSTSEEGADSITHRLRIHADVPDRLVLPIDMSFGQHGWAKVAEQVLAYYGARVPACEIVSIYNRTDCCGGVEDCDRWLSSDVLEGVLRHHARLKSATADHPISLDEIRAEIAQEHPVILWYQKPERFRVRIVRGYEADGTLHLLDPYEGKVVESYEDALRLQEGTEWYDWSETIRCIRPEA